MNIENLRLFCFVAETQSISEAARKVYMSQPAVTKKIRNLENDYNKRLFDRTKHNLVLTKHGQALYPYAKEILYNFDQSVTLLDSLDSNESIELVIGASQTIGEYILPEVISTFIQKNKQIKINMILGNTPYVIDQLKTNFIDIGIVEGITDLSIYKDDLIIDKFAEDELIVITSKSHPLALKTNVSIQDILNERFILREKDSGTRAFIQQKLKEANKQIEVVPFMVLESYQAIKSSVEIGLGISIVPKTLVRKEIDYGDIHEVKLNDFKLPRNLYVVRKKSRFHKVGVNEFYTFLKGEG